MLIINYHSFVHSITERAVYYDELVSLIVELQTIIPEAQAELAALIPPLRCQQRSSNGNDIPGVIKCFDQLASGLLACMIKTF